MCARPNVIYILINKFTHNTTLTIWWRRLYSFKKWRKAFQPKPTSSPNRNPNQTYNRTAFCRWHRTNSTQLSQNAANGQCLLRNNQEVRPPDKHRKNRNDVPTFTLLHWPLWSSNKGRRWAVKRWFEIPSTLVALYLRIILLIEK